MAQTPKPKHPADSPSMRTNARPSQRAAAKARPRVTEPDAEAVESPASQPKTRRSIYSRFTGRAVALFFVFLVLAVSYFQTARVYFSLNSQASASRQEIQQRQDAIASLEDELARWQDPDYVKTQARERLGWVLPGEVGYRVVGPDGQPYGGAQIERDGPMPRGEHPRAWWDKMWGSVIAADQPVPAASASPTPQAPTTIGAPTPAQGSAAPAPTPR